MKKRLIQILLCIFALIFIYSSIKVYSISSDLLKAKNDFNSLQEKIEISNNNTGSEILPKYQKLYDENNDLIGWISIKNTDLNYPVMYTPDDPEYYLRKNYDKEYSIPGVPFIGKGCTTDSSNIIIYGHNMNNGTMFAPLLKYKDEIFWEDNRYINFDTIYEENTYEVIGVFYSRAYKPEEKNVFRYYEYTNIESKDKFDEYYNQVKQNSIYNTGVTASFGDKLLTLSTCEYSVENGRFVVVAKQIK